MRRLARVVQRIEETIVGGGILVIATMTILNALGRTIFATSLPFAEEVSQFAIVSVTFVGLAYAAARGRHIRMSAFSDPLPPRGRKILAILIGAGTSVLLLGMTIFAVRYVLDVHGAGTVSPVLRVPLWIVDLSAPVGLLLGSIEFALGVVRNLVSEGIWLSWGARDEYEEAAS